MRNDLQEVRFDRMVPVLVVARRKACSLAYLPVGALEWHGAHMPFGTDYFTVTHIAEEAARRFGGVVFPPLYYGDNRYLLQECRTEWRQTYVRTTEVPEAFASAFPLQNQDGSPGYECPTQPDDGPAPSDPLDFTHADQERLLVRHLAMVMIQIHLYGFRNILLLPGHGSMIAACREAPKVYEDNVRRRSELGEPARAISWCYLSGCKALESTMKKHWIHADKCEGSVTMVAAPGTVHLELLPEDPKTIPPAYLGHPFLTETDGYNPDRKADWPSYDASDPRNGTSAQYGKQLIEEALASLSKILDGLLGDQASEKKT